MEKLTDLFPHILGASILSFGVTPLILRFARVVNLVDQPGSAPHKIHDTAVPLGGGIVIALTLIVSCLVIGFQFVSTLLSVLCASALILIWGLLDDRFNLNPMFKLCGQIFAVAVLMGLGLKVRLTGSTLVDGGITIFWLVGMTNAFNFVDSMDGLALGLAGIAAAFFTLVTIDSQQPELAQLSAIMLGTSIGLFFFNASPARIFLGDSGAQFLGFTLAAIGLAYNPVGLPQEVSWFVPIMVLGVPIFDTVLVSYTRIKAGKPVYVAARDHSYHRLVDRGLGPTRAVLLMQLCGIALGLISFILLDTDSLIANTVFTAVVLGGITAMLLLARKPVVDDA